MLAFVPVLAAAACLEQLVRAEGAARHSEHMSLAPRWFTLSPAVLNPVLGVRSRRRPAPAGRRPRASAQWFGNGVDRE